MTEDFWKEDKDPTGGTKVCSYYAGTAQERHNSTYQKAWEFMEFKRSAKKCLIQCADKLRSHRFCNIRTNFVELEDVLRSTKGALWHNAWMYPRSPCQLDPGVVHLCVSHTRIWISSFFLVYRTVVNLNVYMCISYKFWVVGWHLIWLRHIRRNELEDSCKGIKRMGRIKWNTEWLSLHLSFGTITSNSVLLIQRLESFKNQETWRA